MQITNADQRRTNADQRRNQSHDDIHLGQSHDDDDDDDKTNKHT